METAGSVTIQISGNIAPFEAALAKAQQLATTFDATVTAKLNGAGLSNVVAKIAAGVDTTNALLAKLASTGTAASAAMEKVTATTTATAAALGKVAAATKVANDALRGYTQTEIDALRSQQTGSEFNRSLIERVGITNTATKSAQDSAVAFQAFGLTQTEVALGAREVSEGIRLGSTQMMALSHSARSAAESLVLGVSPMQALTMQANHLSYALSGPQGLIAASAGVRAAFGTWLTTIPGIVSTAGVAAVAGVAAYMAATRESIKSTDEILQGHKALLDEVANTYPHLTSELKKYEAEAAKLPHSVVAADAQQQIKDTQAALATSLDHLKVDLRDLARVPDVVGSAGAEAFGHLADVIDTGNVSVEKLVGSIGDLRLNPELTPDARHFADGLQLAANEVQRLSDTLHKDQGLQAVNEAGGKAQKTLAEVAAGFKDMGSKAGTADATIAKLFGTLQSGGDARFGVSKAANSFQGLLGQFQQADAAIQEARRNQLQSVEELSQQFRTTTNEVEVLKNAIATSAGKDNIDAFFGNTSNIKDASADIANATSTVAKLFDAMKSGNASVNAVHDGLEMVRQTLVADGFGVDAVNKFVDGLVRTRMQLDADVAGAKQLDSTIQAIRNRTVTITVQTRQIGSGEQSLYDVGGSSIGVTRYGGNGAGPSITGYSVGSNNGGAEAAGYGSSYGVTGGSSTVGVTRFGGTRAAGGPMSSGLPYWVGEHGPELVVPSSAGSVIPNSQSLALAQSAFTGSQPTANDNRAWTVWMNIEANTRKTAQLLDDLKTTGSFSGSGSSSSTGTSSSTSSVDPETAQFLSVLAQVKSNFRAAGIVGGGNIGYGSTGLGATPEQIARAIISGGQSPLGYPSGGSSIGSAPTALRGGDPYNAMLNGLSPSSPGYAAAYAQALAASNKAHGFATGGMIGAGDTQQVQLFKSPDEVVAIFTPQQVKALRGENESQAQASSRDGRPISISIPVTIQSGAQVSKDSIAEMRRQLSLAGRDMVRSIYGR
ncbi:hypothetical protein O7A70_13685 [Mesorhizobium sp. Cs1299R1N1]|uniref:hypothetical protein n=1 Tax=Mesorhizobium sp. Cs1299R1N1 TaxID=3015172 RepID=UPI00301C49D1